MLKSKRSYDVFSHDRAPQCSPHRIQFLDTNDGNAVVKRARLSAARSDASPMQDRDSHAPLSAGSSGSSSSHEAADLSTARSGTKRARSLVFGSQAQQPQTKMATPPTTLSSDRMYSHTEVMALIQRALAERESAIAKAVQQREESLRSEFDRELSRRLEDQYREFVKYQEDCISRQFRDHKPSYIA